VSALQMAAAECMPSSNFPDLAMAAALCCLMPILQVSSAVTVLVVWRCGSHPRLLLWSPSSCLLPLLHVD
jgi:hypothetical protein